MMRRYRGPRNWQLRRQLGKDQFPGIQDNLGARVESASQDRSGDKKEPGGRDLAFDGLGAQVRHGENAGWLYCPASPTHADACETAGFIQGGVHEKYVQ
jgi:hypothetical protein